MSTPWTGTCLPLLWPSCWIGVELNNLNLQPLRDNSIFTTNQLNKFFNNLQHDPNDVYFQPIPTHISLYILIKYILLSNLLNCFLDDFALPIYNWWMHIWELTSPDSNHCQHICNTKGQNTSSLNEEYLKPVHWISIILMLISFNLYGFQNIIRTL